MSEVGVAVLSGAVALIVGVVVGAVLMRGALRRTPPPETSTTETASASTPEQDLSAQVLERAPLAVLALDASEDVLLANRRSHELGLLDRRTVVEPLREVVRLGRSRGKTTKELSLPTVGLPRRVIQARVTALPLPDRVTALVIEDVTEARRVDDVRRDFVANVSHEIKTPVGALSLLAEAAMESLAEVESAGHSDFDDARHFVERISHESARLGRLVSELLDLSRLQGAEARPEPTPVDLDAVVTEAIDRAASHADAKGITIVRSAPASAVVPGVEHQLITAVANLLDNAINYSPEATRVAVAVRSDADAWEITVTDQGLGIPEGDLDRIFERFYRVDPARSRATGGTGLGLAIVKHIVRNHGGEIRVWSSPGAGSSFTLRLPAGGIDPDADPNADTGDGSTDTNTDAMPVFTEPARSPETPHASNPPDQPDRAEVGVSPVDRAPASASAPASTAGAPTARRVVR